MNLFITSDNWKIEKKIISTYLQQTFFRSIFIVITLSIYMNRNLLMNKLVALKSELINVTSDTEADKHI